MERGDAAAFLFVYVREAHAADEWVMETNEKAGVRVLQPETLGERAAAAEECSSFLDLSIPVVVDTMDDQVSRTYGGWPDRIYVIDGSGRVVHRSGLGPWGFDTQEIRRILDRELGPRG